MNSNGESCEDFAKSQQEIKGRYVTPSVKSLLDPEMLEKARMIADFPVADLHVLWSRFRGLHNTTGNREQLDAELEAAEEVDRSGSTKLAGLTISGADVLRQHEFVNHPLKRSVGRALGLKPDQQLDFFGFVQMMALMNVMGPTEPKTKFMFHMLKDLEEEPLTRVGSTLTESLCKEQVSVALEKMTGGQLELEDIEKIVEHIFDPEIMDLDSDGNIPYEAFLKIVSKTDVSSSISFNLGVSFSGGLI